MPEKQQMHANPEVQAMAEQAVAAGAPLDTIKALIALFVANAPTLIALLKLIIDGLKPPTPVPPSPA